MLKNELWTIYKLFTKGNNDIKYKSTKVVIINEINKQISKKIINNFLLSIIKITHKPIITNKFDYDTIIIPKLYPTFRYIERQVGKSLFKCNCGSLRTKHDMHGNSTLKNHILSKKHQQFLITKHNTYCNGCGRNDDFCRCGSFNAFFISR